ncbi:hypothetical protein N9K06_00355 [Omnitrophica bacterium]|nr:hypothetical protein [Candidatus Omnitrophota bacterium]
MKKTAILLSLLMLLSPVSFAASPWMEADTYLEQAEGKLLFGLKNALLGWLDLFNESTKASQKGISPYTGAYHALTDTVVNTVGGILHTATFFIPIDIPLRENGVDLSPNLNR